MRFECDVPLKKVTTLALVGVAILLDVTAARDITFVLKYQCIELNSRANVTYQ